MPTRNISEGRKTIYYVGIVLTTVGFILFLSVFVSVALHVMHIFSGPLSTDDVGLIGKAIGTFFASIVLRAVGGMGLIIIGQVMQNIGRVGLAGSGVILDPQQARKDVEPWSRMQGGVLKDTLDEAGLDLSRLGGSNAATSVDFDEKLRKLHQLHQDGILSDEEYEREKAEVLS